MQAHNARKRGNVSLSSTKAHSLLVKVDFRESKLTGAVVLLWDTPIVEWYYPGFKTGASHLVVNGASAAAVVDGVNANTEAFAALRGGARAVDEEHVCASCLADYFRRVFVAVRDRVAYHRVLDDPAHLLGLVESAGACDAFYEVVVARRVEKDGGVHHDVVRRGCGLCAALRGFSSC